MSEREIIISRASITSSTLSLSPSMSPLPGRQSSAVAALPPPSCLLLPRVRPALEAPGRNTALEWLGLPLAFDVMHDELEIDGYQMYAVEKWSVHRFSIRLQA